MSKQEWKLIWILFCDIAKREKGTACYVIIMAVAHAIQPFVRIFCMGLLLDGIYAGKDAGTLFWYLFYLLAGELAVRIVLSWTKENYERRQDYTKELESRELNQKSLTMDYEYLEEARVQELRSAAFARSYFGTRGWLLMNVKSLLTGGIVIVISAGVFFPALLRGRTWKDFMLTGIFTGLLLICYWVGNKLSFYYTKAANKGYDDLMGSFHKEGYYVKLLSQSDNQKDIRILEWQKNVERELDEVCRYLQKRNRQISWLYTKRNWSRGALNAGMGLFVYLYVGWQANQGTISVGDVVVYISCVLQMVQAVSLLGTFLANTKQAAMYAKDYLEFMGLGDRKYPGTIPVEKRRDHRFLVEFDHVSFRYPGTDTDVIKDLSCSFVIGEKMAIVGKNGSGKTTFIKLLCRLYDVTEGCIKVNGIDIRKYDYQEYCDLFSVVFQDFVIFDLEVGENIAASARPEENRVWDALRKVGLEQRIQSLHDRLHTFVGKDYDSSGVAFSGGERQKMAIARAIYKDAPLVIMDEPTASLDPLAECEVYAGFDRMVGKKTALYISHRLASCRFCEDILVFDQGKLVQRGKHEVLKEQDGLYRQLWEAQAQYYQETPAS
ncbi:MAG: ABC transporter ATP-binding protein [Lachnospiraceae bacterium]|nr:ABC transporter ATP-binding protein [Lachnospiraceae bacterium]